MSEVVYKLMDMLEQMGLSEYLSLFLLRFGVIVVLLILAFVIDRICKRIILPVVRKITSRTEFKWDDYLFCDAVLKDMCSLIAPVFFYVVLPLLLPGEAVPEFVMTLCRVYFIGVIMKLLCSIISSLYEMSNDQTRGNMYRCHSYHKYLGGKESDGTPYRTGSRYSGTYAGLPGHHKGFCGRSAAYIQRYAPSRGLDYNA